jgi:hypothetical protein
MLQDWEHGICLCALQTNQRVFKDDQQCAVSSAVVMLVILCPLLK